MQKTYGVPYMDHFTQQLVYLAEQSECIAIELEARMQSRISKNWNIDLCNYVLNLFFLVLAL